MIQCNYCGTMWLVHGMTLNQKKKLTKQHDAECEGRKEPE